MNHERIYLSGFGNYFESEALPGTLPIGRNSPQKPAFGLYAEQLSGAAFTAPGAENLRSWFYRILPSVKHGPYTPLPGKSLATAPAAAAVTPPDQMRWDPLPYPKQPTDFISGLTTFCVNGDVHSQTGSGVHFYAATAAMTDTAMVNADGDFLIVPQEGALTIRTEFGVIDAAPCEVVVIPRGMKFQVLLQSNRARGYVCENYGAHFQLPYRGPIGANGLANNRDFLTPSAAYEDKKTAYTLVRKFLGKLFTCDLDHSPFDVVGWHGNYVPYKYDLRRFNTVNTVSFDHPDPSIFTVLTSPTTRPGTANVDFVIFPPRWQVAEDTFRPPYYHSNTMSEFMGLIHGTYDAKAGTGFTPGSSSLHNCMMPHGPDADAFASASQASLKPVKMDDTLAFMFESFMPWETTAAALASPARQKDYLSCWQGLQSAFNPRQT